MSNNGMDELVDIESKEGLDPERGGSKRTNTLFSILLVLALLLVFTCLGGMGYYFFHFSGPAKLPVVSSEEQYRGWLKQIESRLRDYKVKQQRMVSLIDEKKRTYNILRNVKNEPADSEICARLVREKETLQESLDWYNEELAKLGDLYGKLQTAVFEINNGNLAKVDRENPDFVYDIKAALEIKQPEKSSGFLDLTGGEKKADPDQTMKFKE